MMAVPALVFLLKISHVSCQGFYFLWMDSELLLIVHQARNLFLAIHLSIFRLHFRRVLLQRQTAEISLVPQGATTHVLGHSAS